ncbi:biotin--[acetyl-CoA-carboxylase] ligase [Lacibacterium aquatile]|uniref:biotin--[biotin carboxyl-carrier protein] ligase n=1 Tax=Lacibacterium aquatile TaxID=1168082 RepID=A0ABW5DJL2_9PROT
MGELMGDTLPPGFSLTLLDEAGSTNDEAARLAASGAAEFTIVQALRQTSARGRQGRAWAAPTGNLYFSMVLRPVRPLVEIAQISLVAGMALAEATAELIGTRAEVAIKWPNDLLIDNAKGAGLLLEAQNGVVILGIGVNVASHPDETPYPATHIGAYVPGITPHGVLTRFCRSFALAYGRWSVEGFAPLRETWMARAWKLGETVRLRPGTEMIHGRFLGIDEGGAMLLELDDGIRRFTAGEMFGL